MANNALISIASFIFSDFSGASEAVATSKPSTLYADSFGFST